MLRPPALDPRVKRVVVARAPLRITLGGGGTDLRSYSDEFGGFLIAGAINKFSRVMVRTSERPGFKLIYPQHGKKSAALVVEHAETVDEIKHKIIKGVLKAFPIAQPHLEIESSCDLEIGKGLGSSGSFTVALVKALHAFYGRKLTRHALARFACDVEIEGHLSPGRQDQYIAAFGGITEFTFHKDGRVGWKRCPITTVRRRELQKNLLLFDTAISHDANRILQRQVDDIEHRNRTVLHKMNDIKGLGHASHKALTGPNGSFRDFALLMTKQWAAKRESNPSTTTREINRWFETGIENGAEGGKLIGAGGGGYLMFYTEKHDVLRAAMGKLGLYELPFAFEPRGCFIEENP